MSDKNLIIYEASAGSGKTFSLTAEYIGLLLRSSDSAFRHILAVTFTNKATAEMKERILQHLYDVGYGIEKADGNFFGKLVEKNPGLEETKIRERAREALSAIVHDFDYFRVETIDSFLQGILSNLAHELGLSASFRVDLRDADIISNAVDQMLSEADSNKQVLDWIVSYISGRIEEKKNWNVSADLKEFAENLKKDSFLRNGEKLGELLTNEYVDNYKKCLCALRQQNEEEMKDLASSICKCVGDDFKRFNRGCNVQTFLLATAQGELPNLSMTVENYANDAAAWLKKADTNNSELRNIAVEMQPKLLQIMKNRIYILSCSVSMQYLPQLRLLNEINKHVEQLNRDNNRVLLARTPYLFNDLITEGDAPFIFEKSGALFKHIMIDEFQDTSTMQWDNFQSLLLDKLAEGEDCMLVGDVKQSIYRWRGGDWSILANIHNEPRYAGRIISNPLKINRRSAYNIIDFNNRLFSNLRNELSEALNKINGRQIEDIYRTVVQDIPDDAVSGYVSLKIFEKKTNTEESEGNTRADGERDESLDSMAQQMENLHAAGLSFEKMAIIVRYNREAPVILNYFARFYPSIKMVSSEAFLLSSSSAVQMVIHALRYLINNKDTAALAFLLQTHAQHMGCEDLSDTMLQQLSSIEIPEWITSPSQNILEMPLYELCELIIKDFQLNTYEGQEVYLFSFLDEVIAFVEDYRSDIAKFIEHWDEQLAAKAISSLDIDGVQIISIHKSKGLAFHTVFLPYCTWSMTNSNSHTNWLWCKPSVPPFNKIPLLPVKASSKLNETIYCQDYHYELFQEYVDNLNLLYVALTRARYNLCIYASYKIAKTEKKDFNSSSVASMLYDLFCKNKETLPFFYQSGEPYTSNASHKDEISGHVNPLVFHPEPESVSMPLFEQKHTFRQSNRSRDFIRELSGDETPSANISFIERGKLLHEIFANIRTIEDVRKVVDSFVNQGVIDSKGFGEEIVRDIECWLDDAAPYGWFDGSWKLYLEKNIIFRYSDGSYQEMRPDRVMVSGDMAVVVDYKFGTPHVEQHKKQVCSYADKLLDMGYKNVSAYVWYVPLRKIVKYR